MTEYINVQNINSQTDIQVRERGTEGGGGEGERERETGRQTDRETETDTETETDRQTDREKARERFSSISYYFVHSGHCAVTFYLKINETS